MCNCVLPQGDNAFAVNKYIISYINVCSLSLKEAEVSDWFSLIFSTDIDSNWDKNTQCVFYVAIIHGPQNLNHTERSIYLIFISHKLVL